MIADAVARGNMRDFKEELGDLLLQIVFQARLRGRGVFDFGGVVDAITQKMTRSQPPVFAAAGDLSPEQVKALWASIKRDEKSAKTTALRENSGPDGAYAGALAGSLLDDVPLALPGLTRAVKLQTKASGAGFDWNDVRHVLAKIREETDEIEAALDARKPAATAAEIGDLFFAGANLARHVQTDRRALVQPCAGPRSRNVAGRVRPRLAGKGAYARLAAAAGNFRRTGSARSGTTRTRT